MTDSEISRIFYWTAWPSAMVQSGTVPASLRTVYTSLKDGEALDPGLSDDSHSSLLCFSRSRQFLGSPSISDRTGDSKCEIFARTVREDPLISGVL